MDRIEYYAVTKTVIDLAPKIWHKTRREVLEILGITEKEMEASLGTGDLELSSKLYAYCSMTVEQLLLSINQQIELI